MTRIPAAQQARHRLMVGFPSPPRPGEVHAQVSACTRCDWSAAAEGPTVVAALLERWLIARGEAHTCERADLPSRTAVPLAVFATWNGDLATMPPPQLIDRDLTAAKARLAARLRRGR